MAAPTNTFLTVTPAEIQAGKPCKQELKEAFRGNNLRAFEVILASGVAPGDAAVAVGHRHLGKLVDGTATVASQPQENLIEGGDGIDGFGEGADVAAGDISFRSEATVLTPRNIRRSGGAAGFNKVAVFKTLIPPTNKIKSSGGKGRFTCSGFIKRTSGDAEGIVGGTLRFGIHDGTSFVTGGAADIDFDDVGTEYTRFFLTTGQITRPTSLRVRFEWTGEPSDWDLVSNADVIGYMGGVMVTNSAALAKWDISHFDGGADTYLVSPDADEIYWWDEAIPEVELTAS